MTNWQLPKICEPESNDVLFAKNSKNLDASFCAANGRFLALVKARQEDYGQRSPMEKPLIALELLNQWRSEQDPPGRFLVQEDRTGTHGNTQSLLWREVGDKEARARISKALKTKSLTSDLTRRSDENLPSASEPSTLDSDMPVARSIPMPQHKLPTTTPTSMLLSPPSLPNKPNPKLGSRRISTQLQANAIHLYGRWKEQELLHQLLKKASTPGNNKVDFVVIEGSLGTGKTALARTLKNPLTGKDIDEEEELLGGSLNTNSSNSNAEPSFFLEAKFEPLIHPNPFQVCLDIFTQFCQQLLHDSKHTSLIEPCRKAIRNAFHEDLDIVTKLIPALGRLYAPTHSQPGACGGPGTLLQTSPSGALMTQKVKSYFVTLLQAIASLVPLVIVFNDLHWASEAAMDILTLLADLKCTGLLFVTTVSTAQEPKPYYRRAMENMAAQQTIQFHKIHLENLQENNVRDLLIDTLDCGYEKVQDLSKLLYSMTQGNPMFLMAMLPKLQAKGFLYPDPSTGEWTYELESIQRAFGDATTVYDLIRIKIGELSSPVQKTLRYISCLGSHIDVAILALVDPDDYQPSLDKAVEEGVLRTVDGSAYQFLCDGVLYKIYDMIPNKERAALHLALAQKLWQHLEDRKDDKEFLFVLLNQLMLGDSMVKEDRDRHAVAALYLQGGETAAKTLGFQTAWVYLEHGISILPKERSWGRDNYDLSLRLHNSAIEVCYCNAQFDRLEQLIATTIQHSRIFDDSLVARNTRIFALGSRHRLNEAIESALATLKSLGEVLPATPSHSCVARSLHKTRTMLRGMTDEHIVGKLPQTTMKDPKKIASLQILSLLNHTYLYAFYSRPRLAALISFRMVQLTLEHGTSAMSSVAFCFFAEYLVGSHSIEEGLRYGKLGIKLYKKFGNEAWFCRVMTTYYGAVVNAKEPMSKSVEPLQRAYRTGLRTGDIEYAMLGGMMYTHNAALAEKLPVLKTELERLAREMQLTDHTLALAMLKPLYTFVLNLMAGRDWNDNDGDISLKVIQTQIAGPTEGQHNASYSLLAKFVAMNSAFFMGDYEEAWQASSGVHGIYTTHRFNSAFTSKVLLIECLTRLKHAQGDCLRKIFHLAYVRRRLKLLEKMAFVAPENVLDNYHLLVGELAVAEGKPEKAASNFRSGILYAKSQGRKGFAALGSELLGRFFVDRGDKDTALPLLNEACELYEEWGAAAKAVRLGRFRDSLMTAK